MSDKPNKKSISKVKGGALFALACVLLLAGCGSVPPVINHEAQARKLPDGSYEVLLSYSVTTSGGPCFNFHSFFTTTTSYSTNWLYLARTNGDVDASNVLVTTEEGAKDLAIQGMKGTICFSNGMIVNLELPNYPDGVQMQGYMPYFLNGTYQLE